MQDLHVDIETYSSIDIKTSGSYKYFQSLDFEILLIAYAFGSGPVKVVDLARGGKAPAKFIEALKNPAITKHAHNANFERQAFKTWGIDTDIKAWNCSAIKAAYCGLPLSLGEVSKVLGLTDKAKLTTGKALIKYFCQPCRPTKVNGQRYRNLPGDDLDKWVDFQEYCRQDVEAERAILETLKAYTLPELERRLYILDQKINDRGVLIDLDLAKKAFYINEVFSSLMVQKVKDLTGVGNPNSPAQLKDWMQKATGKHIESLAKDKVSDLIEEQGAGPVGEVLRLRQVLSKTSIKKYTAMINCIGEDGRGRGFFQFYGANRTGRWAGRLVQLQNLTRNYLPDLTLARETVRGGDYKNVELFYGDVTDTLSQLIRTAFIAKPNHLLAVADFSAIEARVIAWVAGEDWRLRVFRTHGKIYEASAANMFGIPIENIDKGSPYRQKGKVAELALGYQGSVGALKTMGGEKMGLSETEMSDIVKRWRKASPKIVQLWKDLDGCAREAVRSKKAIKSRHKELIFESDGKVLTIELPSGRKLFYREPRLKSKTVRKDNGETWEAESLTYMGKDLAGWTRIDTYGGKLAENIVQAIARDLLGYSMLALDAEGFKIVMHVHDEAVCEIADFLTKGQLKKMCNIMVRPVPWAEGLPLGADGYLTPYYKKD
jgi:DNA polymerase